MTSFHLIAWERAGGLRKERKLSHVPVCLDTAKVIPSEVEAKSKGLKKSKGRQKSPFEVDEIESPSKGPFRVVSFFFTVITTRIPRFHNPLTRLTVQEGK